ncbi:condensin complex subunit 3-like [Montipora foliosa]|uniref:condensin complex subunit 3-like n=1 Tax=Montipora foliosa TaxID=591990 RepID=UPI0035F1901A
MPARYDNVRSVFEEAQRGLQHHKKLLTELKKLHDKTSQDEFQESFLFHLKHAMVVFNREPAVERVIEFAAKYATLKDHRIPSIQGGGQNSDDEEDDASNIFLDSMFTFLLDSHDAKDKAVRFRICQLINKLLNNLDDDAVINDNLADRIFETMLKRLHDKFPAVRVQAVAAISRLQDPGDAECAVISTYLKLMSTDTSAEVRRAVLLNIAISAQTLEAIIGRTQDVTESVRKLAYRILAEKVNIKSFTIAQRVQLLFNGLQDRSETINIICTKELLGNWLKSFDRDVIELLKCLDVEGCTEVAELALKAVLKELPVDDLQEYINLLRKEQEDEGPVRIDYNSLNAETAFCWRCLGEHAKSMGVDGEQLLDQLLPEVSGFCKYIQGYVESSLCGQPLDQDSDDNQRKFVIQQLLTLMGVVDLSDEVGRKNLCQMLHDLLVLPEVPESLVGVLHARCMDVEPEETNRIQELVEIIADVRQPMIVIETAQNKEEKRKWELKVAGIHVKLNQFRDELEQCVTDQDFARAADLKQQITELEEQREILDSEENSFSQTVRSEEKDDPDTLLKCLTIASEMLQGVATSGLNATLSTLVQTLILPGVQNEDPLVRNMAVKCLGLCALLSCEFARTHLVLFLQVAQLDQELVRVTALQVVFDLLLTFGLEAFKVNASVPELESSDVSSAEQSSEKKDTEKEDNRDKTDEKEDVEREEGESQEPDVDTAASVLTILTGILESESNDLRNVAAEGLAKLLLSGRVLSAKLFLRLLLLWYNPTTEDDVNLRHCLGVFFPVFAFASRTNQELVEEAFLPTLQTLFSAPTSSPLASVNINNVAELLVELTDSKYLTKKTGNSIDTTEVASIHVSLSLAVANEILSNPGAPGVRVLCKILTMMDLTGCTQSTLKEMKILTTRMLEDIDDSTAVKMLTKLQKLLIDLTNLDDGTEMSAQRESEDDTQMQCAENVENSTDVRADETTVDNTASSSAKRLEDTNFPEQSKSAERTEKSTEELTEINDGQTSEISSDDKADFQIEPEKSNSKIKSKKGPTKSTKRNKELSPSDAAVTRETSPKTTRSKRKSKKSNAGKKSTATIKPDDENSEKENFANDSDNVFV